jgi:tRNA-binding protein
MHAPQQEITYSDFELVDIRAGTIISARTNEKARKPAFVLEIDFGHEIGVKTTSAQITQAYDQQRLIGMQILAVVNFPRKKVADIWSEVLVLGVVQDNKPTILITTSSPVANGARVL